jgi:hypothetical protein
LDTDYDTSDSEDSDDENDLENANRSDDNDDAEESKEESKAQNNSLFINDDQMKQNKVELLNKNQNYFLIYWKRYTTFFKSPKVHYAYEVLFFVAFLMLFSYTMLCEFNFHEEIDELFQNSLTVNISNLTESSYFASNNSINATRLTAKRKIKLTRLLLTEYILIFWVFSFMADEFYQLYLENGIVHFKFKSKFTKYFDNYWNYLDITGCGLFLVGVILKFISMKTDEPIAKSIFEFSRFFNFNNNFEIFFSFLFFFCWFQII